MKNPLLAGLAASLLCACDGPPAGAADGGLADAGPTGLAVLGAYTHDVASVTIDDITLEADDLRRPRDLAFRPGVALELWVLDAERGVMILSNAGTADRSIVCSLSNLITSEPPSTG